MHLLYYWRPDNYRKDAQRSLNYTLVQNSPAMLKASAGDSLWAFTRNERGTYVLAAELVVRNVEQITGEEYGRYCVTGDPKASRYFDVDAGKDAEECVRKLSIPAKAEALGQSFQGTAAVRELNDADHAMLRAFANGLAELAT
jgi:hypothetical protein